MTKTSRPEDTEHERRNGNRGGQGKRGGWFLIGKAMSRIRALSLRARQKGIEELQAFDQIYVLKLSSGCSVESSWRGQNQRHWAGRWCG